MPSNEVDGETRVPRVGECCEVGGERRAAGKCAAAASSSWRSPRSPSHLPVSRFRLRPLAGGPLAREMSSFAKSVATRVASRRVPAGLPAASLATQANTQRRFAGNRAIVYKGPGKVAVESIDYPKLELAEQKRKWVASASARVRAW